MSKPSWLKVKLPESKKYKKMLSLLGNNIHTICQEAQCPNIGECWNKGTATFLILGNICTRYCGFCSVKTGKPKPVDKKEPKKIADIVKKLGLRYVVITSVDRDDLKDYGAEQFVKVIEEIKKIPIKANNKDSIVFLKNKIKQKKEKNTAQKEYSHSEALSEEPLENLKNKKNSMEKVKVEVLTPDFNGKTSCIKKVLEAKPDVFGHNIEVAKKLYLNVKPKSNYNLSLNVLKTIKKINKNQLTKSSLMIGLGETKEEIIKTLKDLKKAKVDIITIGQYLQPTKRHTPIRKYYTPEEFKEFENIAKQLGFKHIYSAPLVRSSYHAEKVFENEMALD